MLCWRAGCASAPQSQTAASSDVQKRVAELAPHHALVIAGADGTIRTYDGRGLRPLFNALEENGVKDAYVYDKVTGRASSLLLAYGGAKELHTGMLSQEAIPILEKYHIKYTADKTVPYIPQPFQNGQLPHGKRGPQFRHAALDCPQIKQGFENLVAPK